MPNENLKKLYVDELKGLYSAENQLVKALPKMAKAASSDELRTGFETHLEQTKGQVERLEEIFASLDESPSGKKCAGMEGLIKEGAEVMEEGFEDAVLGAGLIGAARRVEYYEMAAYGAVYEFAKVLGQTEHASLLEKTLAEEKDTWVLLRQGQRRHQKGHKKHGFDHDENSLVAITLLIRSIPSKHASNYALRTAKYGWFVS